MLRVARQHAYHGPSPWADEPVLVCGLDTGALPPDAAVQAARDAAAQALAWLNQVRGHLHAHGAAHDGAGGVVLWLGFHRPAITRRAIDLALAGASGAPVDQAALGALLAQCRARHPDYQARILMMAARELDVPVLSVSANERIWQYGWGHRAKWLMETASNADGMLGSMIAHSKWSSKSVMRALGMPTPAGELALDLAQAQQAAQRVGWPCVLKPLDRGGGKGVTAGIASMDELRVAFDAARRESAGPVLVEAHVRGEDHRIMVIDGEVRAVIRREAPRVTGDGRSTVAQLLAALNRTRSADMIASRYLRPVALDDTVRAMLRRQGLAPTDVPAAGQRVMLRSNANMSTGGHAVDVTGRLHPAARELAQAVARATGIANLGLDYMTQDVADDPTRGGGWFIEINTTPGYDPMLACGYTPVQVARWLLPQSVGRIPAALIVTPAGQPDAWLPRLHALAGRPDAPGLAWLCGAQAGLGPVALMVQGMVLHQRVQGMGLHQRVQVLLRQPGARRLLVMCEAPDVMAHGLPLDRADAAWVLDDCLPPPWMAVLRERCGTSGSAASADAADLLDRALTAGVSP